MVFMQISEFLASSAETKPRLPRPLIYALVVAATWVAAEWVQAQTTKTDSVKLPSTSASRVASGISAKSTPSATLANASASVDQVQVVGRLSAVTAPRPSVRVLSLNKIPEQDSRQMLADLAEYFLREHGFAVLANSESSMGLTSSADAISEIADTNPNIISPEPTKISRISLVKVAKGERELIYLSLHQPPRRLPSLHIEGLSHPAGQPTQLTPSLALTSGSLEQQIGRLLADRRKVLGALALRDLASTTLDLSYVDADAAIFALRAMGISAITDSEGLPKDNSYTGQEVLEAAPHTGLDAASQRISADPKGQPASGGLVTSANSQGNASGIGNSLGYGGTRINSTGGFAQGGSSSGVFSGGFSSGYGGFGNFGGFSGSGGFGSEGIGRLQALQNLPASIGLHQLPLVIKLPAPEQRYTGLVGADSPNTLPFGGYGSGAGVGQISTNSAGSLQRDSLGLTIVPSAANALPDTVSGASTRLLVLYHPAYPSQLDRVRKALSQVVDKAARQVYVEGLVLEISEDGLRELGVQWGVASGSKSMTLGAAQQPGPGDFLFTFARDTTNLISPTEIKNRINAIVSKNQAEVLSRPSVITLDNRQATIRVGTDIPISTSRESGGAAGAGRVAFSFQYIPTGILLNVRPRITEDGSEISMQVDATVSATVPNQDLQVIDPTSKIVLASAPTISTRRVQTYARIRNSFPLIIGGLVSRTSTGRDDKVPVLGEVPVLGKLFGREATRAEKREVVIVLIPTIVNEDPRETKSQYPQDDERFDLRGTQLMREQYRLRAEDLQDSQYIRTNRRLLNLREAANTVIKARPELARVAPFAQFAGERIPGETTLVAGMMHRSLQRITKPETGLAQRLFFFERQADGTQRPTTVEEALARFGDGSSAQSFFDKNPGKALAMTFRFARQSLDATDVFAEPIPQIQVLACANRIEWSRLLWQLNQPQGDIAQHTILIQGPEDLERLRLALAVKNTVFINGAERALLLNNWLPGRLLQLQASSLQWNRLLEASVARYFYIGEHAYSSFINLHETAQRDLATALKRPDIAPLVQHIELP